MNLAALDLMRGTDVCTVDPATLVDIQDVIVNTSLPHDDRLLDYLEQIKNPYCVRYGSTVVKLSFSDSAVTMEDRLEKYLMALQ
jgi:hypothetical protein